MMAKFTTFVPTLMLAGLLALGAGNYSVAQETSPGKDAQPAVAKPALLPPVYDEQMMRIAEILGALHYLRELCGANEGQLWRDEMRNLIKAEEPSTERRAIMIARFNRGFRGYREIYRKCTIAAIEANNRYVRQGMRLASEIPSRYGH